MPATLHLPEGTRPSNLHLNPDTDKVRLVSSDLYRICDRIKEISDRLYLVELQRNSSEGEKFGYALMEKQPNMDYLVFRIAMTDLDGRVLERIRYLMSLGLHERIAICDKEREKWEADKHEDDMEELWETMGGPMYLEMERTGFFQRPVSFRPMNRTARRHGRRMT